MTAESIPLLVKMNQVHKKMPVVYTGLKLLQASVELFTNKKSNVWFLVP